MRFITVITGIFWVHVGFAECIDNITTNAPDSRYTNNQDGTITDNKTGLMWMLCSSGESFDGSGCTGTVDIFNWEQAHSYAGAELFAGYNNWRVPNTKELMSLISDNCTLPALNQTIFSGEISTSYWTSTIDTDLTDQGQAHYVNFDNGFYDSDPKTALYAVRLVRLP